jgi:hypothetical protein
MVRPVSPVGLVVRWNRFGKVPVIKDGTTAAALSPERKA